MSIILFKPQTNDFQLIKPEPKYKMYERAIKRFADTHKGMTELAHDDIKKMIFLEVNYIYAIHRTDKNENDISYYHIGIMERFEYLESIVGLIGLLKPMELPELFPVDKIYDGDKYQSKDYYYTMEALRKLDPEQPIGHEAFALLWDYQNWSLSFFLVELISVMNTVAQYQGKPDFFEYLFNKDSKSENKPVSRFMILPGGLK